MKFCVIAALAGAVLIFAGLCDAQAPDNPDVSSQRELVIGTKEAPPFAMKAADGTWQGISVDLWRHVADQLHLHYRFVEAPDVQSLIDGVAAGKFDVAVAALTVTAGRERILDFTQPFYATGLGIAVPAGGEASWLPIIRTMTSFGFAQAILALIGFALAAGFLVWFFERRHNEDFGGGVAKRTELGRLVVNGGHDATQHREFRSANSSRTHRGDRMDDRLDRHNCCIHREHHFGADDQAPSRGGPRRQRSVGCSSGRIGRNLYRGHAFRYASYLPKIRRRCRTASRHCVRINSMHLYMTNRCWPGEYSKVFHRRLYWSMPHLNHKNMRSRSPAIVRSEKHSTLQFSTRYTPHGGSKPPFDISVRDEGSTFLTIKSKLSASVLHIFQPVSRRQGYWISVFISPAQSRRLFSRSDRD